MCVVCDLMQAILNACRLIEIKISVSAFIHHHKD